MVIAVVRLDAFYGRNDRLPAAVRCTALPRGHHQSTTLSPVKYPNFGTQISELIGVVVGSVKIEAML